LTIDLDFRLARIHLISTSYALAQRLLRYPEHGGAAGASEMHTMDHDSGFPRGDALRAVAALGFLGVGAIGLLLPIIPGIPFLIVGVWLLRRREAAPLPLTSTLSRADLTPLERLQIGCLLVARRITMTAESLRVAVRRRRQRGY
jgi:hypothetical protein